MNLERWLPPPSREKGLLAPPRPWTLERRDVVGLALITLAVGVVAVLTLSDRLPHILESLIAPVSDNSRSTRVRILDMGHLVVWGTLGLSATILARGYLRSLMITLVLFSASGFLEMAQRFASSTRQADRTDLINNGVGLAVGMTAGWVVITVARWNRRRHSGGSVAAGPTSDARGEPPSRTP